MPDARKVVERPSDLEFPWGIGAFRSEDSTAERRLQKCESTRLYALDRERRVAELERELAEVMARTGRTWCGFCGKAWMSGLASAAQVLEHARSCPEHPLHRAEAAERERDELRGKLEQTEASRARYQKQAERALLRLFENSPASPAPQPGLSFKARRLARQEWDRLWGGQNTEYDRLAHETDNELRRNLEHLANRIAELERK